LIEQLGGAHAKEASAALAAFNGKPNAAFVAALDGDPATQANALKLVAKRRITTAADKVFALLGSGDKAVRTAAYDALAGVTTAGDFDRLCDLLDKAQGDDVKALQAGLRNALAPAAPDMQYKLVAGRMAAAPQKARYYPLLAQAATDEAIGALLKADDPKAAFAALLTVKNPVMIDVLYELAGKNPDWTDAAISRYTDFATASDNTPMRKYQLYRKGLEANPSAKTQNKLLKALSKTPVFPALVLAVKYMDAPATAETGGIGREDRRREEPRHGWSDGSRSPEKGPGSIRRTRQGRRRCRICRRRDKGTYGKTPRGRIRAPVARTGEPESRSRKPRDPQGHEAKGPGKGTTGG